MTKNFVLHTDIFDIGIPLRHIFFILELFLKKEDKKWSFAAFPFFHVLTRHKL